MYTRSMILANPQSGRHEVSTRKTDRLRAGVIELADEKKINADFSLCA